eukprot:GABV01002296.1.p1 GENE.GABV01002296.1~~GABV01002296.1.p1  ORF type:complete len:238 (+),score=59.67 GABV01002296.1:2-715(+)
MSSFVTSLTNLASGLVPVLKESQFLEKGVLTPDEFVGAGDHLAFKCPTWAWEAGESSKAASWLPPGKQMLATKNVPCIARAVDFAGDVSRGGESTVEDEDGGEGWLSLQNNSDEQLEEIKDMSVPAPPTTVTATMPENPATAAPPEQEDTGDPDDIPDMDDFEEEQLEETDDTTLDASSAQQQMASLMAPTGDTFCAHPSPKKRLSRQGRMICTLPTTNTIRLHDSGSTDTMSVARH